MPGSSQAELCYVLRAVAVGRREAVRYRDEAEAVEAVEGVGASGVEEAVVVVLRVDKGDVEAFGVEELGKVDHGSDMALCWLGDDHSMRPCLCRIHEFLY